MLGVTRHPGTLVPAQLNPKDSPMDALAKDRTLIGNFGSDSEGLIKPTREEAMAAVRTLLAWAGDDPRREGLLDTP